MAKKKKDKPTQPEESATDKAVLNGDKITIEDVKQFVEDGRKGRRAQYIAIGDRSWNEIEKRRKDGQLYGGSDLEKFRRWQKFPLWWSCWQIRRPITFARLPDPTLKDTQGDDPYGRTACVIGERLTRGILKTFDAYPEIEAANDDFLVTNFAWARWCYRNELVLEEEKIRLQVIEPEPQPPQMGPDGQPIPAPPMPPIIVNPVNGQAVTDFDEDEFGPYLLTGQEIEVENEEVYMETGLYRNLYVEKDVTRWNQVNIIAFEYEYSYQEFEKKFGQKALDSLVDIDLDEYKNGKPVIVFEYLNKYINEHRWFAENSNDFFQPVEIRDVDIEGLKPVEADQMPYNYEDLYGLKNFFPCTAPLVINNMTRSFWPTPEYFQVCDLIDDIHQIVQRLMLLTKAIRCRFLYDSSVTELGPLAQETGEAGGLAVPNLQNALIQGKGTLATLVQYFPVQEMIEGLKNMYEAFDQRLNMFYNVTGISDIIRGQTSPDSDKTFGERQMEGKYALNRIEPYQKKLQEWIKDNYELGMEMALKLFSQKTLDEYITPQTLDDEDKQRYEGALELLKSNKRRRFRVDFETDATSAINDQWKKKDAIETANIITKMQEAVAKIATEFPELVESQLKIMDHVIGVLTDGKLFRDEISESIQATIDELKQPKDPEFNKDQADHELNVAKFQFEQTKAVQDDKLEQMKLTMEGQIEGAKIAQKDRLDGFALQIEQIKNQSQEGIEIAKLKQKASELQAEIGIAQQDLIQKRNEFLVQAKEIADKGQIEQLRLLIDSRVAQEKSQLEKLSLELEKQKTVLVEREKWVTEMRLQDEHRLTKDEHQINVMKGITDIAHTIKEMKAIPTPVTVSLNEPKKNKKRRGRIIRDDTGKASELEIEDIEEEVES